MTRSPILKVLSSIRQSGARTLLMGGQACVFYGAAEFSRDPDLLVAVGTDNLARMQSALFDLAAEPIAAPVSVPPLNPELLLRGHALHFRCRRDDFAGLRIDLMSTLRGVPPLDELWQRRTTFEVEGVIVDLMALEDLVRAKQTQRDKDWPMVTRLMEGFYFGANDFQTTEEIEFLLCELRTPHLLIEAAARHRETARRFAARRPVVQAALSADRTAVEQALEAEEKEVRKLDRLWCEPLKRELEQFRHPK